MKKKGLLLPIYLLLNLYLPLIYLGYALAMERPDIYAITYFLAVLPAYSIYGTLSMAETFPKGAGRQLREFIPILSIVIINGFIFGDDFLSSILLSAVILFLMQSIIFFFGVMVLMIKKMQPDSPREKVLKWITFLLIFAIPIILSVVIYFTGFNELSQTRNALLAHGIIIVQVIVAIFFSFGTFAELYKQKKL